MNNTPEFFSSQVSNARRFYLDLAPSSDKDLVVVCGGCEQSTPEYEIRRDTFAYYSVEFVARGRGQLTLGSVEQELLPGTVFTYGPGVAQHIRTHRRDPLVKYFVDFAGRQAHDLLLQHQLAPGATSHVAALGELEEIFELMLRDGCQATGYAASLCASLLHYLLLRIAASRVPGANSQTPALTTYQRCRQYIIDHSETLMSLEQVARECLIDRAYLCRLFRRYDHQTPHQFLMRRKMHLAAERLQQTNLLVKQIAVQLGFADPFHFSRTFKRVFGLSPDSFRQQHR